MKDKQEQRNIPEGWKVKKLSGLFDIKRGGSPRPIDKFITNRSDGLNWLKIGDIKPDGKYISKTSSKILKEGLKKTTYVKKGDFILSNSMSFGRPYILNIDTCIHDGWLTFQNIKTEILDRDFLYFLLLHPKTQYEFQSMSAGSGVQNLKKETVAEISLLFPPPSEQKRIVGVLGVWDRGIEGLERKIEIKKEIKKGLMQGLLTGERRLPGFKGEWGEYKLGDLGETYQGLTGKTKDDFGRGKKFITYMDIYSNSGINTKTIGSLVNIENNENQKRVQCGDLLFTTSSETPEEVGISSVFLDEIKEDIYLNSFCFGFRLKNYNTLLPEFAKFYLRGQGFRKKMFRLAQGSSRFNLSKKYFIQTNIYLPKVKEQKAIAAVLTTADKEINLLEKKLTLWQEQKKYLLNNLVTGEIRTPEDLIA